MIIPEDGCLPKITRTGFAAFNNVMIIKVPEKYRKPGETLYQLATLDRSKKGERWPADKFIDGSNPELEEPVILEHDKVKKDTNTKVNNVETQISLNSHSSEVHADKFERNKTSEGGAKTYSERVPTINMDTVQPETSQNTFRPFSLPVFKPPFQISEYPINKYDGLLGDRPPPNSLFNREKMFDMTAPDHEYNRRLPNGTNFQKGMNFNHNRSYPNDCPTDNPFGGFPRYPNQDVPGNDYIAPQYVDPHNYPKGPPNHLNSHIPFQPEPSSHFVRPLNPRPYAEPPESTHIRPFRDLPPGDLARIPERNLPNGIGFSGVANGTYSPELFPPLAYKGIQRNIPSCPDDNFNRRSNLDSMANNGFRRDYDQLRDNCLPADFSRRNPHQYNNRDFWGGQNKHEPYLNEPYREREGDAQGNNYKYRNQQPWRGNNNGRRYNARGGRRDNRNRYHDNNRNKMNDNKS